MSFDYNTPANIITAIMTIVIIPLVWSVRKDICHRMDRLEDRLNAH